MQPSLADWMMTPWSRSDTFTLLCRMANMVEPPDGAPPFFQALTLMPNSSSSLMLPSLSSLKTTSAVINFARLAGATS